MNAILEEKLRELIDVAESQGSPSTYLVLNLLLASHLNLNHHAFAQHCCSFSAMGVLGGEISATDKSDDEFSGLDKVEYYH